MNKNRWKLEQNKKINKFLKEVKNPTKEDLFNFFEYNFLHPDYETEFTHKVAKNIIEVSYDYFSKLPKTKKSHFLHSLGKLFDVALTIKIWEFQLSRDDASWYWNGIPTYFLSSTALIEPLEDIRREMGKVSKKNLHSKIVCVEGDTESNFVKTIHIKTRLLHFDFPVYNYGGKGEANNLVHFIKEKNRQGVKVLVEYDKDGREKSFVNKIKKRSKVEKFFSFSRDFESSFPPQILKQSLESYIKTYVKGENIFTLAEVEILLSDQQSFIKAFEAKYKVNISKSKLGIILGMETAKLLERNWNNIFNERKLKKPYNFEILKFLKFLIT